MTSAQLQLWLVVSLLEIKPKSDLGLCPVQGNLLSCSSLDRKREFLYKAAHVSDWFGLATFFPPAAGGEGRLLRGVASHLSD
jgi:hypothetical protein